MPTRTHAQAAIRACHPELRGIFWGCGAFGLFRFSYRFSWRKLQRCFAPSARWWVCARPITVTFFRVAARRAVVGAIRRKRRTRRPGGQRRYFTAKRKIEARLAERSTFWLALRALLCAARLACGAVAPSAASCSRIGRVCCWPTSAVQEGCDASRRSRCADVSSARVRETWRRCARPGCQQDTTVVLELPLSRQTLQTEHIRIPDKRVRARGF